MTEEEFREWLQKGHGHWPPALVERTCKSFLVSAHYIISGLLGIEPTEEQVERVASELRRELVSNVALRDTGVATEQELLDQYHPSDEKKNDS